MGYYRHGVYAWPAVTRGSVTLMIPGTCRNAAASGSPASALPTATTGCPAPAGKCRARTCSPAGTRGAKLWPGSGGRSLWSVIGGEAW